MKLLEFAIVVVFNVVIIVAIVTALKVSI